MRGPKPKPTKMKELEGNPGKRPLPKNEPKGSGRLPRPPVELSDGAKKAFKEICAKMPKGVLDQVDKFLLAKFCVSWDIYLDAYARMQSAGVVVKSQDGNPYQNPYLSVMNRQVEIMNRLGSRMGLSPSDRTRLRVESEKGVDDKMKKVGDLRQMAEEAAKLRRVK